MKAQNSPGPIVLWLWLMLLSASFVIQVGCDLWDDGGDNSGSSDSVPTPTPVTEPVPGIYHGSSHYVGPDDLSYDAPVILWLDSTLAGTIEVTMFCWGEPEEMIWSPTMHFDIDQVTEGAFECITLHGDQADGGRYLVRGSFSSPTEVSGIWEHLEWGDDGSCDGSGSWEASFDGSDPPQLTNTERRP